jgi:hypothetical protein
VRGQEESQRWIGRWGGKWRNEFECGIWAKKGDEIIFEKEVTTETRMEQAIQITTSSDQGQHSHSHLDPSSFSPLLFLPLLLLLTPPPP